MDQINSDSHDEPLVEQIAEEILERKRRGEHPSLEEYYQQYPEQEEDLRSFLPALLAVESLKPDSHDKSGSIADGFQVGGERRDTIGDYRILREIGRGGMGVVYEAEQQALGRHVALKVVSRQATGSRKAVERFQREAKAAARMHHTNIVPVFDVGSDGDHLYYAMQLIQGQSLDLVIDDLKLIREQSVHDEDAPAAVHDRNGQADSQVHRIAHSLVSGHFHQEQLNASGQFSPPVDEDELQNEPTQIMGYHPDSTGSAALPGQSDISTAEQNRDAYYHSVASIGRQTASALAYAHARGIIHRDIKPSNLLLDGAGIVWITDFGLAKTGDQDLTHTGDILGTLRYMSPERYKGQCDVRADVYSLGLSLYELLTLNPAFESADRLKLIEMIADSEPPSLRGIDPRIPRDLETIILKAIDKDPRRRYQSADDMEEDLQRYLDDEPILARRVSSVEQLARWGRRNKGLASALTVVAMLLVVLAVGSTGAASHFRSVNSKNEQLAIDNQHKADKARKAQEDAEHARAEAETQKTQAEILAAQQFIRQAENARSGGDISMSLGYVVEALKRDQSDPDRVANHRRRIANDLRRCPRPTKILFHEAPIQDARLSHDGKWIVTAAAETVHIWNLATGKEIESRKYPGQITSLTFTPDDERILASFVNADTLWDWRNDQFTELPVDPDAGSAGRFGDRRYDVMSIPTAPGERTAFSLKSGEPIGEPLKIPGKITHFNHYSVGETTYMLYTSEVPTGEMSDAERDAVLPQINPSILELNPDLAERIGRRTEPRRFRMGLWNLETGDHRLLYESAGLVRGFGSNNTNRLCLSPDGTTVACFASEDSDQQSLRLLRTSDGQQVEDFQPPGSRALLPWQFTPDNSALLCTSSSGFDSGTGLFYSLNPKSGEPLRSPIHYYDSRSASLWSISPTSHHVLVLNAEGNPQVFDLRHDDAYFPPLPQSAPVTGMCWSPDGALIAVATKDGGVRVWDVTSGEPRNAICKHPGEVVHLEFTRDGSHVVTAGSQEVRLWPVDPPEAQTVLVAETTAVPLASRIGTVMLTSQQGTRLFLKSVANVGPEAEPGGLRPRVEVWNLTTGELEFERNFDIETGVNAGFPFGGRFATRGFGGRGGNRARYSFNIQTDTRQERVLIYRSQVAFQRSISETSEAAVLSECQVWELASDRVVSLQIPEAVRIQQALFTSDSSTILVLYQNAAPPSEQNETPRPRPDSKVVAQLFDSETGKPVGSALTFQIQVRARGGRGGFQRPASTALGQTPPSRWFNVSSDGKLLASVATDDSSRVIVRDIRKNRELCRYVLPQTEQLISLDFKRHGEVLAIVSEAEGHRCLRVIDSQAGERLYEPLHRPSTELVRWIIDDEATKVVIQRIDEGELEVCELASGRSRLLLHEQPVTRMEISSDGRLLLTHSEDRKVRCWNLDSGELLHSLDVSHLQPDSQTVRLGRGLPAQLQFSPDGRWIVFASVQLSARSGRQLPTRVQIWDVQTGQPVSSFETLDTAIMLDTPDAEGVIIIHTAAGYEKLDLSGEKRPLEELSTLAQILSGRQLNHHGHVQPLSSQEFRDMWETASAKLHENLADPPTGLAWHRRWPDLAGNGQRSGRDWEVQATADLWHLDRLLEAEPDRFNYYMDRTLRHLSLGHYDLVLKDCDDVISRLENTTPAEISEAAQLRYLWTAYQRRGFVLAQRGRWVEASQAYQAASKSGIPRYFAYAALTALKAHDQPRYEALCEDYLQTAPRAGRIGSGSSVAQSLPGMSLLLVPRTAEYCDEIKTRLEDEENNLRNRFGRNGSLALELLSLRHKDYDDVLRLPQASATPNVRIPHPWFIWAMAYHHRNEPEQARAAYQQGVERLNQDANTESSLQMIAAEPQIQRFFFNLIAELLREEADSLINRPATP